MTWSTHALAGLSALWLLEILPAGITVDNIGSVVAAAVLGALLPDLDAAESKIKHVQIAGIKPFAPLSIALHRGLGHRGLLHSLAGLGFVAAVSIPPTQWWGWQPSVALLLGYASHLAADALTRSGIPLLYPRKKRHHLLPRRWRITTGSQAEELLMPFLAFAVLFLLLSHLSFAGI
jgi:inner membrane protein